MTSNFANVLDYNPQYRILICRKCQYAIQKCAIESHLLRHKIYREDRQRLLSSIAQLELLEPDDVSLPPARSLPIAGLLVTEGYRCSLSGCAHLCASVKRMRRHWSENHERSESSGSASSTQGVAGFAVEVNLQTFFRGTKLKYFEVSPLASRNVPASTNSSHHTTGNSLESIVDVNEQTLHSPPVLDSASIEPLCPLKDFNDNVDLDILKYFHHFTTTISFTLPCDCCSGAESRCWQTNVVFQALQERRLMCGLLALSACHLSTLPAEDTVQKWHAERSLHFKAEFLAGLESATLQQSKTPGVHIRSLFELIHNVAWGHFQSNSMASSPNIIQILRTFDFSSSVLLSQSENHHCDLVFVNRLHQLPSRMTEVFGRPDNVRDVVAVLSAINTLDECYAASCVSNEPAATFRAMANWIRSVPDDFYDSLLNGSTAVLVVLAYWTALVKRAEDCGCWFIKGAARILMEGIIKGLPSDDDKVLGLIKGLLD